MNNQEQNQNSISQEVLAKIKKEGVKMRPKFYFIFKAILWILAFTATTIFILYITSFVVFSLRASGAWFLPRFGFSGIKLFWLSLPWVPILIAGGAIILLEVLAKHFNWVWRRPIVYSFVIILVLAVVGGFLLEKSSLHSQIFMKAQKEPLPGIGNFYRQFGAPQSKNAHFGEILSINDNGFVIQMPDNKTITVIYTEKTRIPSDFTPEEGKRVSVIGRLVNGLFEAFDIREIKEEFRFFNTPPHPDDFKNPTTTEI